MAFKGEDVIHKLVHNDLASITVSKLIASFGKGMVVVFIPLLLLNSGLALWQVCGFYVAYAVCKLGVNYPSARLINRYGARLGLIVGTGSTAVFMGLLTLFVATGGVSWILIGMALTLAMQNSFTWNSEHLFISRAMKMERKSRDLAMIESLNRGVGVVTPLVGGFIAAFVGQAWLTGIAAVILAIALIPVWRIDRLAGGHKADNSLRYSLRFAPVRDIAANFGFNAHTLVGVMVWPVYLAVFVPDFRDIGVITTLASLVAVVVLQIAGRRGDGGKGYQVLVEGTASSSVVHLVRVFASSNPVTITVISALYDIVLGYQQNSWASLYYAHTRKGGINYIMSMEIAGDLAYLVMWSILGAIAYTTGNDSFFTVAFGAAAVLAWLCLLVRREEPALRQPETPLA